MTGQPYSNDQAPKWPPPNPALGNAAPQPQPQPQQQPATDFAYPYPQYAVPAGDTTAPAYVQHAAPAPAPAPVAPQPTPQFVPQEELAPVAVPTEPRYLAPVAPARDPRRTALAAIITFAAVVIAIWGLLGFLGQMTTTLASVNSGSTQLKEQLTEANVGLADLDRKTAGLNSLATDSVTLKGQLGAIDQGMGNMLGGITSISDSMEHMNTSLTTLGSELDKFAATDRVITSQIGVINGGLAGQQKAVAGMAKDVSATGKTLGGLPPRLQATNSRLTHVNGVVNFMGCKGITQKLKVNISLGPIPNGNGLISATIVPPGAWGTNANGTPCQ